MNKVTILIFGDYDLPDTPHQTEVVYSRVPEIFGSSKQQRNLGEVFNSIDAGKIAVFIINDILIPLGIGVISNYIYQFIKSAREKRISKGLHTNAIHITVQLPSKNFNINLDSNADDIKIKMKYELSNPQSLLKLPKV